MKVQQKLHPSLYDVTRGLDFQSIHQDPCFIVCGIFYYKTRKTLKKYEREFAKEIEELSAEKKKIVLENSKIASKIFSSYNKTI